MITLNLLPDLVLQRRKDSQTKKLAIMGLVGWSVVLVLAILGSLGYELIEKGVLAHATSVKTDLNKVVNSSENIAFRTEALEVQSSLKALNQLFGNQEKMSLINTRLADLTPKTVILKTISISNTKKVSLTGTASAYNEVGKYIVSLKESGSDATLISFSKIQLGGATLGDKGTVSFTLSADLILPVSTSGVSK